MGHVFEGVRALAAALLAVLLVAPAASAERVIPAQREGVVQELVAPHRVGERFLGARLETIEIGRRGFSFGLQAGSTAVRVQVGLDAGEGYRVEVVPDPPPEALAGAVDWLRSQIASRADEAFWKRLTVGLTDSDRGASAGGSMRLLPDAPVAWLCWVAALLLLLGLVVALPWLARRHPARISRAPALRRFAGAGGLLVTALTFGTWFVLSPPASGPDAGDLAGLFEETLEARERLVVWIALLVALALLVGAGLAALRRCWRARWKLPPAGTAVLIDAGLVFLVSGFVRFVLTTPNLLTDGGSGYSRLLDYGRGFGGLSVLVEAVLPAGLEGFIWPAIAVMTALAVLAAPAVVLLGRSLGLSRVAATFGGLFVATHPVHAALFTSDFLAGPLAALQALGIAMVAAGTKRDWPLVAPAGLALLAFTLWGRPELLMVAIPLLLLILIRRTEAGWWRWGELLGLAWLAAHGFVRFFAIHEQLTVPRFSGALLDELPWGGLLASDSTLPWWLLILAVPGLLWGLRRGTRAVLALLVVGAVAGLFPALRGVTGTDPSATFLELFRYGAGALTFVALAVGLGVDGLVAGVGRVAPRASRVVAVRTVIVLMAGGLLAVPLSRLDYLATRYGPATEEALFVAALAQVPEACGVIAPDDISSGGGPAGGSLEILQRYQSIARETLGRGERSPRAEHVVGVSPFLEALGRSRSELPPLVDLSRDRRDQDLAGRCWYFFDGEFCWHGNDGQPPPACAALRERLVLRPVFDQTILWRSHRLVSRPGIRRWPWWDPSLRLVLWEVTGQR